MDLLHRVSHVSHPLSPTRWLRRVSETEPGDHCNPGSARVPGRTGRALEEARAAILFKRSKEAIRGRLESSLNAISDEQQKRTVLECLNRDDLEEMKSLTQQLQGQAGQKTSEEKLTALRDTLKQYCTGEELDRLCADAFQIRATTGFREARSFVVEAHDQLRARSKELEEQATVET